MTILRFLILALATYRFTILLTKDKGPGWVMLKLRLFVKKKTPKKAHLDEGVECPWCASVWFGTIIATCEFFFAGKLWYESSLLAFALSGASIIFNQTFTKSK